MSEFEIIDSLELHGNIMEAMITKRVFNEQEMWAVKALISLETVHQLKRIADVLEKATDCPNEDFKGMLQVFAITEQAL